MFKAIKKIIPGKNNTPDDVMLKPRKMGFEVDASVPRHWAGGDPVKTHFLNAVSAVLPQGEDYFIKELRRQFYRIDDPELQLMCRRFCGQEGHHAREHGRFNQYLIDEGYRLLPLLDQGLIFSRNWLSGKTDDDTHLAFIANVEHMTSMMSQVLLKDPVYWLESHNTLSSMLLWHAVEEIEHKSVAHDIYEHICGDYSRRVAWMPAMVAIISTSIALNQLYMLYQDGELKHPRTWTRFVGFYWGRRGIMQEVFNREFWQYMKPGFHPWQQDDRHLIQAWEKAWAAGDDMRQLDIEQLV